MEADLSVRINRMNFPDSQKTGALGELDVTRLFLSWSWNVGRDQIDEGYDLCIAPDRNKFKSVRFLVQVKGTAIRKRTGVIVAQVSKPRLRQYAEALIPVFIVRVMGDGRLYWLHAQHWAQTNCHRLSGSGNAGVRFDISRTLDNREAFEAYLSEVLPQGPGNLETAQELYSLIDERRLLNSLDSRLEVQLEMRAGRKQHKIYATSEPVETKLTFTPDHSPENLKNLDDAIEFGLPRSIEVQDIKMVGSPLFEHISKNKLGKAFLSIAQGAGEPGWVRFYPGTKYSITAQQLALEAEMFRGRKGVAISNESKAGVFDLSIRMTELHGMPNITANLSIRPTFISDAPIQTLEALRPLALWADQVLAQRALHLELEFKAGRVGLTASADEVKTLASSLYWIRTVGRLHLVARALKSDVTLAPECTFPYKDASDIDLAYSLLKGDRQLIQFEQLEFESTQLLDNIPTGSIYCTTTMSLMILGQSLGDIPIAIELTGYFVEALPEINKMRISKGANTEAWMSYAEHSNKDGWSIEVRDR